LHIISKNSFNFIKISILGVIWIYSSSFLYAQKPHITLINPSSNVKIFSNSDLVISWHSFAVKKIRIDYSADTGKEWINIVDNLSAKPSNYIWDITNLPNNNMLNSILIKITSKDHDNIFDIVELSINSEDKVINKKSNVQKSEGKITNSLTKIMPLGDSITEGIFLSNDQVGYRRILDSLLNSIQFNFDFVGSKSTGLVFDFDRDHEGHSGWHAKHKNLSRRSMVDSLYKWLESAQPDLILLHIGTNDIGELDIFNETVSDVVSDVNELLDIVDNYENNYNKNVFVFLSQIIKRIDDPSTPLLNEEDSTIVFNDSLAILISNRKLSGDNIELVNFEDKLSYYSDLPDGVHPNDAGYRKMGYTWFEAITKDFDYYPIVLQQPKNRGTVVGKSVEFSISASGFEPLLFQWYKNNVLVYESTDTNYTIDSALISDDNSYIYCNVSNSIDTISSDTVKLYVAELDQKVDGDLISYYNFEEGEGVIITDTAVVPVSSDLLINGTNGVEWVEHGLDIQSSADITSNSNSIKIYDSCVKSSEISIEAWIKPSSINQSGPSRILTFSENSSNRNFTIGQELDRYVLRLRTTETNNNGLPEFYSGYNIVDTNLTHIVFTRNSKGKAVIYVNGEKNSETDIPGSFSSWSSNYLLKLANEFESERPWFGTFYQLSIFSRALDSSEVFHNYYVGENGITDVKKPNNIQVTRNSIGEIDLNWNDNSENEYGFFIERSDVNNKEFIVIDSTESDEIFYMDATVAEGIPYYYRIKGYNIFGTSIPSDTAFVISKSNIIISPSALEAYDDTLGNVFLNWENNSTNEFGFIVERRADLEDSVFYVIDSCNTNSYIDTIPKPYSIFEYRVKAYNFDKESGYSNIFKVSGITDINDETNKFNNFELMQNYPNPFNPITTIKYIIPTEVQSEKSKVKNVVLTVYDILGREVKSLVNQNQKPGSYEVKFDGRNLPSGVYYYQLNYGNLFLTKKMLVLK